MNRPATPPPPRPVRWWPALAVLVLSLLTWALWVWLPGGLTGQDRSMRTLAVVLLALVLLLLWLLTLSRLPWKVRLAALAGVALAVAAAAGCLEIRGVTGDLVPILAWRWSAAGEGTLSGAGAVPGGEGLPGVADYPQFLGPHRDATLPGVRLARDWRARPPRELWRRPVGPGWSAFAVAGGLAVTQEQQGEEERVVAYDLATGEERWSHSYPGRYETTIAGIGPRATPTIDGGQVFTLGAVGRLSALVLATGEPLWSRDVLADHGAANPEWGKANSPLVLGHRVVVSAGGPGGRSLVAYDRASGDPLWAGGGDRSGYASPFLATLAGVEQIVIFNRASVAGHDPTTGEVLWSYPWSHQQPNVAQPLPLPGDRLLVSSGYGVGSELLEIGRGGGGGLEARRIWKSPRLKAKFTNVVEHGGYVYGLDDGTLVCLDPATGERCWKRGRYGHGQVILAGDLLIVQAESGEVALVEPSPEGLRELGRIEAFRSKTWNPPALAGRYLLVRNNREAACYELALEG